MIEVSCFRWYVETKSDGSEWKACIIWLQFSTWFRPCGTKFWSFIIQKFSAGFSLSFNVSADVVVMFLSYSMIINFSWLLKSWSCLLKCVLACIALEFLISVMWLLSLTLFPIYQHIEFYRYKILINNETAFVADFMVDFKRFVGLITSECCCWNKLMTAKTTFWIKANTLSWIILVFSFDKFFVVMDGIRAKNLF